MGFFVTALLRMTIPRCCLSDKYRPLSSVNISQTGTRCCSSFASCPHPPLTRSPFSNGEGRGVCKSVRFHVWQCAVCAAAVYPMGRPEKPSTALFAMASEDLIHRCGGPPSPCAGKVRRGRTGLPAVFAGRRQSDGGSFISRKCSIRGRRFS